MASAGQNSAVKAAEEAAAKGEKESGVDPNHPCVGINRVVDADKGTIELLDKDGQPRKRFALVGFASSTSMMAPFNDPEWAIVGMTQLYRRIPREDAHIEIHKEWNTALVPGSDHKGWLANCGIPVLMTHRVGELPTSVRFPIETLIDEVTDYYTSTVAYLVAYFTWHIDRLVDARLREMPVAAGTTAADMRALTRSLYAEYYIGIFGIDLIVGEEYDHQKACAEFWIGYAVARGITVVIPPQSALCKQRYRYGYEMEPQDLIRDSDLAKRRAYIEAEMRKHEAAALQLAGAQQELEYMTEFRRLRERGGAIG
jgi:hypothetical protein